MALSMHLVPLDKALQLAPLDEPLQLAPLDEALQLLPLGKGLEVVPLYKVLQSCNACKGSNHHMQTAAADSDAHPTHPFPETLVHTMHPMTLRSCIYWGCQENEGISRAAVSLTTSVPA